MRASVSKGSVRTLALAACVAAGCGAPPSPVCPTNTAPALTIPCAPRATAPATGSVTPPDVAAAPAGPDSILVTVVNGSAAPRSKETVALAETELKRVAPSLELGKTLVLDGNGAPVVSQVVTGVNGAPAELVFQTDLAANGRMTFRLRQGERKPAAASDYKAYGRFVRERHDDFAWENDLVAHRMYGPDLETTKKEPLVSSGIDVWAKRVPRLLVNEWYMTDDYHQDHGDGADFYAVGKTRGCGGLGVWANEKLFVSRNFVSSRVLASGPVRLVFELEYATWDAAGMKVSETKRVTLDAGTMWNRFESSFTSKRAPLSIAIGIAKHPGGVAQTDAATASLRVWEPVDGGKNGNLGCAVVLAPGARGEERATDDNFLFVTPAKPGEPLRYFVGSAWDRAGHVTSADAWANEVRNWAVRNTTPAQVSLEPAPNPNATPDALH